MQGVTFGRVPLRLWEELQVKIQLIPVRLILLLISSLANLILASSNHLLYSSSDTTLTVIGMKACLIPHNSEH